MSKKHIVHIIRKNKLKLTDQDIDDIFETKDKKVKYVYCFDKKIYDIHKLKYEIRDLISIDENNKKNGNDYYYNISLFNIMISSYKKQIRKIIFNKLINKIKDPSVYSTLDISINYIGTNFDNKQELKPIIFFNIAIESFLVEEKVDFVFGFQIKFIPYSKNILYKKINKFGFRDKENKIFIDKIQQKSTLPSLKELREEYNYTRDITNIIYLPHGTLPSVNVLNNLGTDTFNFKSINNKTTFDKFIAKCKRYVKRGIFDSFIISDRDFIINFIGIIDNALYGQMIIYEMVIKKNNLKLLYGLQLDINSKFIKDNIDEMINYTMKLLFNK